MLGDYFIVQDVRSHALLLPQQRQSRLGSKIRNCALTPAPMKLMLVFSVFVVSWV